MLSLVLRKTRNAPIPTMKIHQTEYYTGFLNSTRWNKRCSFKPKAQAVNKAQRQLRPKSHFLEIYKSPAQFKYQIHNSTLVNLYLIDICPYWYPCFYSEKTRLKINSKRKRWIFEAYHCELVNGHWAVYQNSVYIPFKNSDVILIIFLSSPNPVKTF